MHEAEQFPLPNTAPVQGDLLPPIKLHKDSIILGDRMRSDMGDLEELADSIKEFGLIHPPTIDKNKNLIAGGRRYAAMTQILKWEWIPVTLAETDGSEIVLRMMELEENLKRKEMTWKERCISIARVHNLHRMDDAKRGEVWSKAQTGQLLGIAVGNVQYCVDIATLLKNPNSVIHKAESLTNAFELLLEEKEKEANKRLSSFAQELTRQQVRPATNSPVSLALDALIAGAVGIKQPSPQMVINEHLGIDYKPEQSSVSQPASTKEPMLITLSQYLQFMDCRIHMTNLVPESIDHIVTDWPYAIDMDMLEQGETGMKNIESVREEHKVEDNIKLFHDVLPLMYRVLKPDSFCVIWYDLDTHNLISNLAEKAGFKVCRWPLIWAKTHRCKNQSAQYNFTKATEVAMVLRKGNITLTRPQGVNYWMGSNEEARARFKHPFAKPIQLWQWIFQAVAIKGQTIYDPFAGKGSGVCAAIEGGYTPLACEMNEQHFADLSENVRNLLTDWFKDKQVTFQ